MPVKFRLSLCRTLPLLLSTAGTVTAASAQDLAQNTIHQEVNFTCSVASLYQALTDTTRFSDFTGYPAQLSADQGGPFSAFDGQISGRHIELQPNENIVQAWRVAEWPPGTYSVVRFALREDNGGTTLTLDQAGFPEGTGAHLREGWYSMYWQPLSEYCE